MRRYNQYGVSIFIGDKGIFIYSKTRDLVPEFLQIAARNNVFAIDIGRSAIYICFTLNTCLISSISKAIWVLLEDSGGAGCFEGRKNDIIYPISLLFVIEMGGQFDCSLLLSRPVSSIAFTPILPSVLSSSRSLRRHIWEEKMAVISKPSRIKTLTKPHLLYFV